MISRIFRPPICSVAAPRAASVAKAVIQARHGNIGWGPVWSPVVNIQLTMDAYLIRCHRANITRTVRCQLAQLKKRQRPNVKRNVKIRIQPNILRISILVPKLIQLAAIQRPSKKKSWPMDQLKLLIPSMKISFLTNLESTNTKPVANWAVTPCAFWAGASRIVPRIGWWPIRGIPIGEIRDSSR